MASLYAERMKMAMVEKLEHASAKPRAHPSLRQSALRLREWLAMALPLWADRAQRPNGSWVEHLLLSGAPDFSAERRWRVMARQSVSYAQGTIAGFYDGAEVAERSFDTYWAQGWTGDHMVHRIAPDGTVTDGRDDLYDHAFALLACARMLQLTGDTHYHAKAKAVMAYLDTQADPAGGWREGTVKPLPRRQNPHMHLLEASMALFEATGNMDDLAIAHKVMGLFETHFLRDGTIGEFFDADWTVNAEQGDHIEPGHAAEWIWLIRRYELASGEDYGAARIQLYDRTFRRRLARLFDCENRNEDIVRQTTRCWVQTEAVKAHLAMAETGHPGAAGMAAATLDAMFGTFLRSDGLWNDQLNACDAPVSETIPVSTLYHIVGMAVEADRIVAQSV